MTGKFGLGFASLCQFVFALLHFCPGQQGSAQAAFGSEEEDEEHVEQSFPKQAVPPKRSLGQHAPSL